MKQVKFDETDRRAVIDELGKRLCVRLQPVPRRRKWLRDELGRNHWVLGGYGEWHGIPNDMMDAEVASGTGGFIVVAIRHEATLEIYIGPLAPLVENRRKLFRSNTGDYQFTFRKRGSSLIIDPIPGVVLSNLAKFSFGNAEKSSLQLRRDAEKLIDELSEQERRELLETLRRQT